MTGSVLGKGIHGIVSKRDISTKKKKKQKRCNDVTNAVRDRYKIYMLAQTREQIFPEIVKGLKEEMTFEIHLLKHMGVSPGRQGKEKGIPCTTKIEAIMVVMIYLPIYSQTNI